MSERDELDEMVSLLSGIEISEVSLVTRPANQKSLIAIWKSDMEDDSMGDTETQEEVDLGKLDLADEVVAYIEGLEQKVESLTAKLDQAEAAVEEKQDEAEKLIKSADPELQELVKSLQAKAEAAEMLAKAEADHRREREWVAKVDSTFPNLPGSGDEIGPLMKAAEEALDAAHWAKLQETLTAANEALGKAFVETGSGQSDTESDSPMAVVNRKVDALIAADSDLDRADAITKVFAEDPDLYTAYRQGA